MIRRPLVIMTAAFAAGIVLFRLVTEPSGPVFQALLWTVPGAGLLFLCIYRICEAGAGIGSDAGGSDGPAGGRADGGRPGKPAVGESDSANFRKKTLRAIALMMAFSMAGVLRASLSFGMESRFAGMDGESVEVTGRILQAEEKDEDTIAAVILLFPEKETAGTARSETGRRERVLVTIEHCPLEAYELPGRETALTGTVKEPVSASNPGSFDYALYLRSRKILCALKADGSGMVWIRQRGGWWAALRRIEAWKSAYGEILIRYAGEEKAGLLQGILFGDDQSMDEELRDSFGENGIGHLLAASGLHVGFVYSMLFTVFRRPRTLRGHLPILGVLAVYAVLADCSPSVMRAMLMITVSVIGRIRLRRTDFLTNIAFCAGILLLYEPAVLFSSGFQLSFAAALSLAVVYPRLERSLTKWTGKDGDAGEDGEAGWKDFLYEKSVSALLVTVSLQVGMGPLTLKHFHYISVAGLALNLPAIALAGWIVPAGMILMPASLLAEAAGGVFCVERILKAAFRLIGIPVRVLLWMNREFASGGRACIYTASPSAAVYLIYYVVLILLCSEGGVRLRSFCSVRCRSALASGAAALLLLSCGAGCLADGYSRGADLVYVDVGQGNCAHLRADGGDIIFDSGGSEFRDVGKDVLMPYFLGSGMRDIDLAVISHLHTDHYKGLCSVKDYVPVRNLALSAAYRSEAAQIGKETGVPVEQMLFLEQGDSFSFRGVVFTVLAPEHRSEEEFAMLIQDDDEENNFSLVLRAEYKGTEILFTGDISSELELELTESCGEDLASDILTVAHHGSRFSSCAPFLETVGPEVSVIQVGANNLYGHPSPETLERIGACGCILLRNDLQGAVMIRLGKHIRIHTMR